MLDIDIVFACDFRSPTEACRGAATRIRALSLAGLRVAILPLHDAADFGGGLIDPRLQRVMDECEVPVITPATTASCAILFIEMPQLFVSMPPTSIALRVASIVCRIDHLPVQSECAVAEPPLRRPRLARLVSVLERLFDAPVWLAPTGPLARSALAAIGGGLRVLADDLPALVDLDEWRRPISPPADDGTVVAGRHEPAAAGRWPDSVATREAYGAGAAHTVRFMGQTPTGIAADALPSNWQSERHDHDKVAPFLAGLHFYVHFTDGHCDGCPLGVIEALASGLIAILPIAFEPVFEEGAIYAGAAEVSSIIARIASNPVAYATQAMKGRAVVARKFAVDSYPDTVARLLTELAPAPAAVKVLAPEPAPRRRVMMISSNGEGIGHLTRLLAIAERLPADIEACFFTLSQAADIVRQRGFPVDVVASHRANGLVDPAWNDWLVAELSLACRNFDPAVVVFDGSVPYEGLKMFAQVRRDLSWFWVRRGLWRDDKRYITDGHVFFDRVIEPADFCHDEDEGETAYRRDRVFDVSPILLIDPADRPGRAEARLQLGLDPDWTCVALHLGPESNAGVTALRNRILARLCREPDVRVVTLSSPLGPQAAPEGSAARSLPLFPLARYGRAFDLVIGNAGYNNFHECVFGAVPSIFVPKDGPEMDDQLLRARYAEGAGLSLTLRVGDPFSVDATLTRALSPDFADQVRSRAGKLSFTNGATRAAELVAQAARAWRVGLPLSVSLPRL